MSRRDDTAGLTTEESHGLERREFLQRSGAAVLAATAAGRLVGPAAAGVQAKPKHGGTLRLAHNQDVASLLPEDAAAANHWMHHQIYDQLVEQFPGASLPKPGLAKSWEVEKSGAYIFHLRDAEFSNGLPVTAADVKFSLDRFANPNIDKSYKFVAASIKNVRVRGPRTVEVTLNSKDGAILEDLGIFMASIISKRVHDRTGDKGYASNPVGSGAFRLKRWQRGRVVELVRNKNYWRKGKPYLDGVNYLFVTDENARILQVQSGQVDVAVPIPFAQIDRLQSAGVRVQIEPAAVFGHIFVNNNFKPLGDENVRLALNYAVPRAAIAKTVFGGRVQVANSVLPRMDFWDKTVKPYPYNLAQAKQFLAKSSVPRGFTLPYIFVSTDVEMKQVAQIIANSWSQIGVNVQLQGLDLNSVVDALTHENYAVITFFPDGFSSDTASPDELTLGLFDPDAGFNSFFTQYSDATARRLAHQAHASTNLKTRRKLYHQLQRYGMAHPPWIPLFFTPTRTALRKKVHGFRTTITAQWRLENVWLS
jgi:peptide/nickel transport system substrate-binding protein